MKIQIVGSTHPGYSISKDSALRFSGIAAGICYMPDTFKTLQDEPLEKTVKRIRGCIKSGHHSVLDHVVINFIFENIPKFLAMVLNNEKVYTTSEKSARYTIMKTDSTEGILYDKWLNIFKEKISEVYPKIDESKVQKLAQENARYLISVFTPATTMMYTVSLRQLNLIISWMKKYIAQEHTDTFSVKVKDMFQEFLSTKVFNDGFTLQDFAIPGLNDGAKNRSLSIFAPNSVRYEEFGECYCTNYLASFAQLAQAHRHRTIKYEMSFPERKPRYYVPPIIQKTPYRDEWLSDIASLEGNYPQGRMVLVNERGTLDDLVLKCMERLCGQAQLEIANQTQTTLKRYLANVKSCRPDLYQRLLPYSKGARCTFPDWKCQSPCIFGGANALKRTI